MATTRILFSPSLISKTMMRSRALFLTRRHLTTLASKQSAWSTVAQEKIYDTAGFHYHRCEVVGSESKAFGLSGHSLGDETSKRYYSSNAISYNNYEEDPDDTTAAPASSDSAAVNGVVPFVLADIGEGIQEVEVLEWFVHVGDDVKEFDAICRVQSDKATVEITSRFTGKILSISPETKVTVGQPLVHIQTANGLESSLSSSLSSSMDSTATTTTPSTGNSSATPTSSSSALSTSKIVPFLLADIGEGIQEVEVLQWYVHVGDEVKEFDTICQVQSDKATVDITSRFAGKIVEISDKNPKISVGQPLVHIETNNAPASAYQNTVDDDKSSRLQIPTVASHFELDSDIAEQQADQDSAKKGDKYLASPAVRKLTADNNINVRTLQGTGPNGRILKADVLQFMKQRQQPTQQKTSLRITPTPPPKSKQHGFSLSPFASTQAPGATVEAQEESQRIVAMTGYNRFLVHSMQESLKIPHMGLGDEIIVDKLVQFRNDWNASQKDEGLKLGMQSLLVKACSLALKEHPSLNAKTHDIEKYQVCYHANHDIGVAMDTKHGLVVPVVRNVENLSLIAIQQELNRLKQAAAAGTTSLKDLSPGPTFTLSNIGAIGVGTNMSPLLVPPLIAMGSIGRIQRLPRFADEDDDTKVVPMHVMFVNWAADHRFLDGASLARFHLSFSKYASNPLLMLPLLK